MKSITYILAAATAAVCAVMLLKGFRRSDARLLLWTGLCFAFLSASHGLVFLDPVVAPHVDFHIVRLVMAATGATLLLCGLVWEGK